jgi:hypothetical protein
MYAQFKTDENLETKGIVLDYGDFRVTIARAGGANKRFERVLDAKAKPFRRALQTETMDPGKADAIMQETFAEAVILNWETRSIDGPNAVWNVGIENPDGGELLPFNKENVLATFKLLPDLYKDIQEQAQKSALFRQSIRETEAKN